MKKHLLTVYLCGSLALILLCTGFMGFWLLRPYNPITFNNGEKDLIVEKSYRPGDYISWYSDYTDNTIGISVQIDKSLVDGTVISYATVGSITDGKSHKFINTSMRLPPYIPAGIYHIHQLFAFKVNPIRTVYVVRETEDFEVLPALEEVK